MNTFCPITFNSAVVQILITCFNYIYLVSPFTFSYNNTLPHISCDIGLCNLDIADGCNEQMNSQANQRMLYSVLSRSCPFHMGALHCDKSQNSHHPKTIIYPGQDKASYFGLN